MPGRPPMYLSDTYARLRASADLEEKPWLAEFDRFVENVLGPRPVMYERAQREYDAARAFGLLVFDAFGELLEDADEGGGGVTAKGLDLDGPDTSGLPGVGRVETPADSVVGGPGPDDAGAPRGLLALPGETEVVTPNFAVLGPDGSALIEGKK